MSCFSPSAPAIAERPPAATAGELGTAGEPGAADPAVAADRAALADGSGTADAATTARLHHSRGQGLVEYGLILTLIVVVAIIALVFFGDALAAALNFIGQIIDSAH